MITQYASEVYGHLPLIQSPEVMMRPSVEEKTIGPKQMALALLLKRMMEYKVDFIPNKLVDEQQIVEP